MAYKMSFFSLPTPVALFTVLICALLLSTFDIRASAQKLQNSGAFDEALSMAYSIERRLSDTDEWATIGSFDLTQRGFGTPARVQNMNFPRQTLSNEQRKQLGETVDLVFYRVVPSSSDKQERVSFPTIAVSPCTIIRGFSVLGKTTLVLTERLKVVSHSGVNVVGLQVSSTTNVFQSSMEGDTCDRSIVLTLFPQVEMVTEVGFVSSLPVRGVRYEELGKLTSGQSRDVRKDSSKSQADSLDDEDSSADDYDDESDEEKSNTKRKKRDEVEPVVLHSAGLHSKEALSERLLHNLNEIAHHVNLGGEQRTLAKSGKSIHEEEQKKWKRIAKAEISSLMSGVEESDTLKRSCQPFFF